MPADPHWLEYIKAFGAPLVALLAAFVAGSIAWRQWKTAHNRLKIDLFDRRMKTYDALWASIKYVHDNDHVDYARVTQFNADVQIIKWLFDSQLYEYVREKIYKPALELTTHYDSLVKQASEMNSGSAGIQWRVRDPRTETLRKAFQEASGELHALFDPFMRVSAN